MTTRVPKDVLGIPGDECDCGRRASIRHCPECGSTRIYARSNRPHKHLNGEVKFVEIQFRCQSDGHLFIDSERQFCNAPPVSAALARQKVARLATAARAGEKLPQEINDALSSVIEINKSNHEEEKIGTIEDLEKAVGPQVVEEVNAMPQKPDDFVPPANYTRAEYNIAERVFRMEWVDMKLHGIAPTKTADEYVERKLKGEVFQT